MIWAFVVFFGAVALGALLRCVEWTQPSRGRLAPRWKVVSTRWERVDLPAGTGVQVPIAPFAPIGSERPFSNFFLPPHEQFVRAWKAKHGDDAPTPQFLFGPIGAPPKPRFDGPDGRVALVKWPDGHRELVPWVESHGSGWSTIAVAAAGVIGMFALVAICAHKKTKEAEDGQD